MQSVHEMNHTLVSQERVDDRNRSNMFVTDVQIPNSIRDGALLKLRTSCRITAPGSPRQIDIADCLVSAHRYKLQPQLKACSRLGMANAHARCFISGMAMPTPGASTISDGKLAKQGKGNKVSFYNSQSVPITQIWKWRSL